MSTAPLPPGVGGRPSSSPGTAPSRWSTRWPSLAKQTHPIAHLVVVDNGPDQPAREVVEACGLPATWLPSWRNLGGAGGFALGMLHALALGADWVWLADDDGRAADDNVLATLVELADRRGLAAVSPTVADADDPDRLAFPVRRGLTWHRSRAALAADVEHGADDELLPGIAALFNGALFRASTLDVIGVPDLRLFVRGDEVEMHRRLVRSGLPFGTALRRGVPAPGGPTPRTSRCSAAGCTPATPTTP